MRETRPTFDFAEVTAELDRRRFISMGFERIEALLAALGNPERGLRVVQVVGTNGKGTTSVALSAALEVAGETTGTYLSPHVLSYAERVRMRGEQVSEEAFADGLGRAISVADELGIEVTQFELLTAGALTMFRDAGVTWAVMEAGLGARHDATTAAGPESVVLTNVSLDHTQYLGDTVEEIASEKLASVPTGGTLILGAGDPTVQNLARERCNESSARLVDLSKDAEEYAGSEFFTRLAPYAAFDVALGFRAAGILLSRRPSGLDLRRALSLVCGALPGRFEEFEVGGVPVILDGGHNPHGVAAALQAVKSNYPGRPISVVFGVLRDKDIVSMLDIVLEKATHLALTTPEGERAADPEEVFRRHVPEPARGVEARVLRDIGAAIEDMSRLAKRDGGVVLVTGSLSTGAAALKWMSGRYSSSESGLDEG